MVRRALDPDLRTLAVHLVLAEGRSLRDVGAQLGVTQTTIDRWVKASPEYRDAAQRAPEPVDDSAEPDDDPDAPEGEFDTLGELKRTMQSFLRSARDARAAGKEREAAAMSGHAARLAPVIARLEAAASDDPAAIRVTPEQIAQAEATIRERLIAAASRPLLCAHCSRALSLELGGVTEEGERVTPRAV